MNSQPDSAPTVSHYDAHIVPSESAARVRREKDQYGKLIHDDPSDLEHVHTRDGYSVDQEGLINNYAIEPEMYVQEPGDLKAQENQLQQQRSDEVHDLGESEEGRLTMEHDWRHRGPGLI
jgi:hypothetical protein